MKKERGGRKEKPETEFLAGGKITSLRILTLCVKATRLSGARTWLMQMAAWLWDTLILRIPGYFEEKYGPKEQSGMAYNKFQSIAPTRTNGKQPFLDFLEEMSVKAPSGLPCILSSKSSKSKKIVLSKTKGSA